MYDAILIGAGHHNLVAASYLARAGWKVAVFERGQHAGGCLLTAPATLPGFHHDLMPCFVHLLFLSPAYREFKEDWGRHGLAFRRAAVPAASLFPDGDGVLLCDRLSATLASIGRHSKADAESCRRLYLTTGGCGSNSPASWRPLRRRQRPHGAPCGSAPSSALAVPSGSCASRSCPRATWRENVSSTPGCGPG